jgi:subtilisin family serine protease
MKKLVFHLARLWVLLLVFAVVPGGLPLSAADAEDFAGKEKVVGRSGYAGLLAKAESVGTARVIVKVRADFTVEPALGKSEVAGQRASILKGQNRVLSELAGLGLKPSSSYKYKYIPHIAMTVSAAGLKALAASADTLSIQEDATARPAADPTPGWSMPVIGATAMQTAGITGTGMTVAVIDTGVDKTHPYLVGAVTSEACYSTNDTAHKQSSLCPGGVSSSTAAGSAMPYGGSCPTSTVAGDGKCDHGTHVAGIVAGRSGIAGSPGAGVAPGAGIIAIQVFTLSTDTTECAAQGGPPCVTANDSDVVKGLERVYALYQAGGITIASVNMSLGGGEYTANCDSQKAYKDIIDTLKAANIATVASSGNEGYCGAIGSPACISSAVSVGATDVNDKVGLYSNSAPFMTILAPGSAITSSIPEVSGTLYATWNGTSMAAPHVAGMWALIRQQLPTATVTDVTSALASTGSSITDSSCTAVTKNRINGNDAYTLLRNGSALTVTIGGNKKGAVAATGLTCIGSAGCSGIYTTGSTVTLTAQANSGNTFDEWTGCDTVADNVCTVVMDSAKTVTASFGSPPVMSVSPGSLGFGSVKLGAVTTKQVTIKNTGANGCAHLIVGAVFITTPSDFAVTATTCADPLAKGESCTVTVSLAASSFGTKNGLMTVATSDTQRSPMAVKLTGNAVPPTISVSGNVNFGTVTVGQVSAVKTVIAKNTGLSDLTFSFVGLDGKQGAFIIIGDGCTGTTLAKGASCEVDVTFRPTATGSATGNIGFESNDPNAARAFTSRRLTGKGK